MDLYSQKEKSIPQKTVLITIEFLLLGLAYWILFGTAGSEIAGWFGWEPVPAVSEREIVIFSFSIIVFLRMGFMMLFLLKRKIPWEEAFTVPLAFALYYIGFAVLVLPNADQPLDFIDCGAIVVFVAGSFINTFSELQRHFWKKRPENKGKLYTEGLFRHSMHINFFGDLLWVVAYAIVTRNALSIAIPVLLFCLFAFYNIPQLDAYLQKKYGDQFDAYRKSTRKFIPFVY